MEYKNKEFNILRGSLKTEIVIAPKMNKCRAYAHVRQAHRHTRGSPVDECKSAHEKNNRDVRW